MRAIVVFLYMLIQPILVFAGTDVSNASDYPQVDRFPGSYIVQYDKGDANYRLILGGLQKINGVLRPEKEQRIEGKLTQITYRIPELNTPADAFSAIENQINQLGATVLFKCQGRDCGSSNQWANSIFHYSRLYGVEESQLFAAYQVDNQYFSLYAVKRGNKRVYLRLEVLVTEALDFQAQFDQMNGVPFRGKDSEFQALVAYLNANPKRVLWLVGSDFSVGSRQQQLDKASEHVSAIKVRLIEQNISAERIYLHSLGGFSTGQREDVMIYVE